MAGAFLAIGAAMSALTKNQVIAFVLAAAACFFFLMTGVDLVLSPLRAVAPPQLVEIVASFSFISHFTQLTKGVVSLSTVLFFGSGIVVSLIVNALLAELKKAS